MPKRDYNCQIQTKIKKSSRLKTKKSRFGEGREDEITLLVTGAFLDGMALSALGLEDFLSGLGISGWSFGKRRHFSRNLKRERESGRGERSGLGFADERF